jgi:streptomycin 6-kinase
VVEDTLLNVGSRVSPRLERVSAELGLDRERVRMWTVAHTLAWGFDVEPLSGHIEVATWLLDTH